ncbi:MAG: hypothetical protein AAB288_04035 [Acidobacteriota bacterium]
MKLGLHLMSKLVFLIFIVTCILAPHYAVAGRVDDDLRLVDQFDPRDGCETVEMRLDSLFAEASKNAGSHAYAVIHQGSNVYDNAVVNRKAINYARFRGFPPENYTVMLTRGSGDIRVALWVGINGKALPIVSSDAALSLPHTVSRTQFAEDTLELVKIDGRDTHIGTGNPSCLYLFSSPVIWDLLKANEEFDLELIVKTRSTSNYKKLVAGLKSEFREVGVPSERLRFVYRGRDKDLEGGGSKLASVATNVVKRTRK